MTDPLRGTLRRVVTAALLLNVAATMAADPPPVTAARLVAGNTKLEAAADWLSYGGSYANWRYSPLTDISRDNVGKLAPAWMFQAGVQGQVAGSPVVADGMLFFTAAHNNLYGLDAVSGEVKWHYEHQMPSDLRLCCGPANRGVAIAGNKIFMATLDARLIAFERSTGKVLWNIQMADYKLGFSATSAPLVVKDKVIVGNGGGEFATRGFVAAYDLETGKERWRRYTVPQAGEKNVESWAGDSWKGGGAPAWMTGAYDAASNMLYWSTGNPAPLFNGDARKGDNLYSDSVIALDADSGELRWHFQATPHDTWDYDATNGVVLIDVEQNGKQVRALAQPNRNGYLYLLDAASGKFLRGTQYIENLNWSRGLDANGRPDIDPKFVPTTEGLKEMVCPGPIGGNNGSTTYAYSPVTRLMYVPVIESCMSLAKEGSEMKPGDPSFGGSLGDSYATLGKAYGHLTAIDPASGKIKWRYRDKYPMVGGALATAGGVIFTGNQEGYALALDQDSGKVLWKFQTGSGIRSQPITYRINGRQYVAIGSGTGGLAVSVVGQPQEITLGSALVVFALPK
jgi:alcohol dehydrogenase (cytochrome c)